MSVLFPITDEGITVSLAGNGKLKVRGSGYSENAIKYIRDNKSAIIESLLSNSIEARYNALPQSCPFKTGGSCPPHCRFADKILIDFIKSGPIYECPFFKVCKERKE